MAAVRAYRVLTGQDQNCADYVAAYAGRQVQTVATANAPAAAAPAPAADPLYEAIRRGLKAEAGAAAREALKTTDPARARQPHADPGARRGGGRVREGHLFLPQLLQAATAAQAAFEAVKAALAASACAERCARADRHRDGQG